MLKAIHAMESRGAAEAKALAVAEELDGMRLGEAVRVVREGFYETLAYTAFPREHWRRGNVQFFAHFDSRIASR